MCRAKTWTLVFTALYTPGFQDTWDIKNCTQIGHVSKKAKWDSEDAKKLEDMEGMFTIIISWRIFMDLFEMSTPLPAKGSQGASSWMARRWPEPRGPVCTAHIQSI